ncbi:ABC transporter substrate-binding protein, partial [Desulfovibrio desulfuricans]|nr:ABC transporter substrate-binding protein [Desulfovibrio desulfuricans]
MEGYDLKYIPLRELDERLDYYTPVIITSEKMIKEDPETVQKFMNAVKKGYEYAIEHPDAAAEILSKYA